FVFYQAEGGIRDFHVTGVQTCALPICVLKDFIQVKHRRLCPMKPFRKNAAIAIDGGGIKGVIVTRALSILEESLGKSCHDIFRRSEERRVGKESRSWSVQQDEDKKHTP